VVLSKQQRELIEELKDTIRRLHGAEASHVESVPVKETFKGETIWEGIVEVFELHGHPKAPRAYAWARKTDDPQKPRQHVTILHVPPITSPTRAVRAAILEEFRNRVPAKES
jgi:hypothetical protein